MAIETLTAAAPLINTAIGGIGQVFGGKAQSRAAQKAAQEQVAAQQAGLQFMQQAYGTGVSALQPFVSEGQTAAGALAQLFGLPSPTGGPAGGNALQAYQAFTQTPFYTFPLQQAEQGITRGAATLGTSMSPGTVGQLGKLGAGYASENFMKYVDQLQTLAGRGETAGGALMTGGLTAGQNVLGAEKGIGQAEATGTVAQGNQLANLMQMLPALLTGGNLLGGGGTGGLSGTGTGGAGGAGGGTTQPTAGGGILGGILNLLKLYNVGGGGGGAGGGGGTGIVPPGTPLLGSGSTQI